MAVNAAFAGREYPPEGVYEVGREKIREFAEAVEGADDGAFVSGGPGVASVHPAHTDPEAARALGYPDVIAPPTFAVVVAMASSRTAVGDPGLGLNYAMVVHGEQRFDYSRPLHAGDVVTAQSTISAIREVGSITMLTTETQIRTVDGEHVCTGFSTLVERGAA